MIGREPHKVTSTPDDIRRFGFGAEPAFEALIAEVDGEFAGMCLFFPELLDLARPARRLCAGSLSSTSAFAASGVGERLLQRLAACRASAGRRLSAPVGRCRATSRRSAFYERLGIAWSDERADPRRLWRGFRGARRGTESGRAGTGESMKAFYAEEQKRHDPEGLPVQRRAAAEPGKAGARRAAAGRRERPPAARSSGRAITGSARSPPSTRRNISNSCSTSMRAGSASRARRPR